LFLLYQDKRKRESKPKRRLHPTTKNRIWRTNEKVIIER